tara:strand:- start:2626 stop:2907 length:282 start_codon:yes stop_codon:yes gene_type:complete
MKSIQNYIQSAQDQQLTFDAYTVKFDRWGNEINISYFGFTTNNDVWYWFHAYNLGDGWSNDLFFDHRYNRINGHIIKSYKQEKKAMALLNLQN